MHPVAIRTAATERENNTKRVDGAYKRDLSCSQQTDRRWRLVRGREREGWWRWWWRVLRVWWWRVLGVRWWRVLRGQCQLGISDGSVRIALDGLGGGGGERWGEIIAKDKGEEGVDNAM